MQKEALMLSFIGCVALTGLIAAVGMMGAIAYDIVNENRPRDP